jgi:major outer membrane protein
MKRLLFTVSILLGGFSIQALPVANPIDASLYLDGIFWCGEECNSCYSWCDGLSVRAGFWGDYVFNRHMETKWGTYNNIAYGGSFSKNDEIPQFSIYKNQGVLTLNWCNWIDVYGLLGSANFYQQGTALIVDTLAGTVYMNYSPATCYGVGGRVTLFECGFWGFGIESQYFGSNPKLNSFEFGNTALVFYPDDVRASSYNEWQVGLGASYRLEGYGNSLVPYVAIKFAGSNLKQNNESYLGENFDEIDTLTQGDLKNSKTVGFAVGMTATSIDKGGITVEGRFGDEKAAFVNGQIRF